MHKIKYFFRKLREIIYAILVIFIFALAAAVGIVAYKFKPVFDQYVNEADSLVEESSASTFCPNRTSYVYASNGEEIAKLHIGADIDYVAYDCIPVDVVNAFISIEDKRFYKHHGVDWASTAKSLYLLVRTGDKSRGGSTITQQLVRNVFTEHVGFEKSYDRTE